MPNQPTEQFADLTFPVQGIDLTSEFETQRTFTTPTGVNVRAFEPGTLRGRGGSRCGLSKYISDTASTTVAGNVIQHLNFIVDPTTDALIADDGSQSGNPDYELDPSTGANRNPGGRYVRKKGSGRQTNRKVPKPALAITANNQTKDEGNLFTWTGSEFTSSGLQGGDTITSVNMWSKGAPIAAHASDSPFNIYANNAIGTTVGGTTLAVKYKISYTPGTMTVNPALIKFIQANSIQSNQTVGSVAYTNSVVGGNLLICGISSLNPPVAPTDTLGNTWIKALGTKTITYLTFWYCIANGSGANTVSTNEGAGLFPFAMLVGEYSGVKASGSLDNTFNGNATGVFTSMSTGTVTVSASKEGLMGIFGPYGNGEVDNFTMTPGTGFNKRTEATGNGGGSSWGITLLDKLSVSASAAVTGTIASTGALGTYAAVGASFFHA